VESSYSLLLFACRLSFYIPGSLRGSRWRFLHFNPWTILSVLALAIAFRYGFHEIQFAGIFTNIYRGPSQPENSANSSIGQQLPPSPPGGPPSDGAENMDSDSAPGETVVHFSHVFPHLVSCFLNICLRIATWILYPTLLNVCESLTAIKRKHGSLDYTWNEICVLFFSLSSELLRQWQFWQEPIHMNASMLERILGHMECLIAESFPLKMSGVVLVALLTLVAKNLEDATKSLENAQVPIAWTVEGSSFQI
jgi:hypothetical protein